MYPAGGEQNLVDVSPVTARCESGPRSSKSLTTLTSGLGPYPIGGGKNQPTAIR